MKATLDVKLKALNDLMDEYNPKDEDQDEDKTAIDELEEKIMLKIEEKLKDVTIKEASKEETEKTEKTEETEEKENEENGNN